MNIDTLEQDPCNTCGYEEGSIYCKEHCPHEAKIGQEPVFFPPCQDCNTKMDEIRRAYDKLQEPSGDAISRKIISAFLSGLISDETERKKALEYINELPPVNPTKTGRWILIDKELSRYKCSECGEVIRLYKKSEIPKLKKDETLSDYPFSHCGAKMTESKG